MKKPLLLLFISYTAVTSAVASSAVTTTAEESKWLCGAENSNGFMWRNDDWVRTGFLPEDAMFSLRGTEAGIQMGESIFVLSCEIQQSRIYCHNETQSFVMDRDTGRAGFSSLMGALIQSNSYINLFQCTNIE